MKLPDESLKMRMRVDCHEAAYMIYNCSGATVYLFHAQLPPCSRACLILLWNYSHWFCGSCVTI